ncbi:MAG: Na/Pi cotransporter family protein [Oscillospiraceae bacterium]|nr:Na/Pi cotransporter family protein [Oscillospiraceae bacterium]MBQ9929249.1 Na/Pi cotransporter family protein [Oscillospiraceae bacterium]
MATYILKIITLLGGLALFLFGMDVMGRSLERQAGSKLQNILAKMSSSIPKGFLLGLAVTAVIQSSSATTVMVVGFVNSGIMTLKQAVGVIMGANVGTTVTAWILSLSGLEGESLLIQIFKPTTLAPVIGVIGIVLFMFTKSESKKNIGMIMLGFMSLMTGMDIMGDSMAFLEDEAWFAQLMVSFSNPLLGILFGAVLTAILQSSSASIGILQGLSITGAVSFGAAIPIILGQNIGTCITALMGAIGANRNARRTAVVHLLFNIMGVVIFSLVFYGIGIFAPWSFIHTPVAPWDISIIHTAFNLLSTAVLLPMNGLLVKLAYLVVPEADAAEPEKTELLDERLMVTPTVAIQRAYEVAGQMAQISEEAFQCATTLLFNFDARVYDNVIALEDETDRYEDALGTYMVKFSGKRLSVTDNRTLNTLLYSISDLERIADHAVAIAKAAKEIHDKGITFSHQAQQELQVLQEAVNAVIRRTATAFVHRDMNKAMKVEPQEQVIDGLVREIKSRHVRRLRDGLCTVESGFILEDMLTAFERTADHCSNVAVEMLQVAEGKLEAHEYLNALKAGELHESAKFSERFARYRSRYAFPEDDQE